jgi:hypothetical protein
VRLAGHCLAQSKYQGLATMGSRHEFLIIRSFLTFLLSLNCKFWNETGEILPFLLLLDSFCDPEKAGRTRDEATAHPQDNHQNSTRIIPKFTPCHTPEWSSMLLFPC